MRLFRRNRPRREHMNTPGLLLLITCLTLGALIGVLIYKLDIQNRFRDDTLRRLERWVHSS